MLHAKRIHLILIGSLLCSGCASSINVTRVDGSRPTMVGVPYNLPMTVYSIAVTRHVTGCSPTLTGSIDVAITQGIGIDPSAMFTLNSDGWWSTSDIKSTFGVNGVSTGLNTAVTDVTGQVISDVVSSAAAIAPMLAALGAGNKAVDVCDPKVSAAVDQIKTLKDVVSAEADELAANTARVTLLTAELNALGTKADKQTKDLLVAALIAQDKVTQSLTANQKQLADDLKLTSDTQTVTWPESGSDALSAGPFSLPDGVLAKWAPGTIKDPKSEIRKFDVYLDLARLGNQSKGLSALKATELDTASGIPVRFAVSGRLRVCDSDCSSAGAKVLGKLDGQVLQIGYAYSIPVKGGRFKSATGAVAFDAATGAPITIEAAHKTAAASTLSGTIKTAAPSIAGIPSAISAAQLASVKAQSDMLLAENTLVSAKASNATAETLAPLQAQLAVAQAQVSLNTANDAIAKAKATQGGS